jgi:hypothetical protein
MFECKNCFQTYQQILDRFGKHIESGKNLNEVFSSCCDSREEIKCGIVCITALIATHSAPLPPQTLLSCVEFV